MIEVTEKQIDESLITKLAARMEGTEFDPLYNLSFSPGWSNLISILDTQLLYISPNYKLYQAKTKFGTLRYYAEYVPKDDEANPETAGSIFRSIVAYYEYLSGSQCETCGAYGELRKTRSNWYYTSCARHKTEK